MSNCINFKLFKFLFFDQYLYNNDGGDSIEIANEFAQYLEKHLASLKIKLPNITSFINKFIDIGTYGKLMNEIKSMV